MASSAASLLAVETSASSREARRAAAHVSPTVFVVTAMTAKGSHEGRVPPPKTLKRGSRRAFWEGAPGPQTNTNRSLWITSSAACGSNSRTSPLLSPITCESSAAE